MMMAKKMPDGRPALGIVIAPHGGPDEDDEEAGGDEGHDDHDAEHQACDELAEILGLELDDKAREKLCEALSAFVDARMSHDEGGEEEEPEEENEEDEEPDGGKW